MKLVKLESVSSDIDYGLTESATDNNTGHKFLRITDIRRNIINWDEVPFCEFNEEDSKKYELHDGDIVFARTGSVGNTGLIINSPKGAVFASYLIRIRPNQKILDPKYLSYYFQTTHYWNQIDASAVGAIQGGLNATKLKELTIPLPPLAEQQRIASLLTRADRLRRLRRHARELSDSLLQSVFLEMFGDPKTNPKGWEVEKIGKHIKNIRYGTGSPPDYQEKGIPFIRATNVKQGTIKLNGLVYISEEDAKKISKCRINAGDLIVVRSGVNSGDCALIPPEYGGAYAAYDLIVEVPYPTNYFLNITINSPFGKIIIETLSRRAGQPHVNAEQIESMEFPFPPLALQEQFAGVVARHESLRRRQAESARQAEGLFQSMLSEAFRG